MRLTFQTIKEQFLRNIGQSGSTDTTILADFALNLGQRYQLIFGVFKNYQTQQPTTDETVASQQYYDYPPGLAGVDNVYITIGDVNYPLQVINSPMSWDVLNALTIQPSAIPQFIYPRRDDYGIWPIPQDEYTITFSYFIRDRILSVDDYSSGTVICTNADATVVGTDTVFTSAMVGRWFTITDTTTPGQGYWFRVLTYTDATHIELDRTWPYTTIATAVEYKIGESPEIPEEGHILLIDGVTADYYSGIRSDIAKATWFNNKFWTGDGQNPNRDMGNDKILGGLIGLANRYADRDSSALVSRGIKSYPPQYKVFATEIS